MNTAQEIAENLQDAGCDQQEIELIMDCYINGDQKNMEKLIAVCRNKQLEKLHYSQRCIDRLDFLSYQLEKQRIDRDM